jgi:hypothetical protein
MAFPRTSGGISLQKVSGTKDPQPQDHRGDPDTYRYRKALERAERRMGQMARDLTKEAQGESSKPRGWRCPRCNRFQREIARFCDQCDPQVGRPE